jgi:uncharacterized protein (TIGR02271 family)
MTTRTVAAMFRSRTEAESAAQELARVVGVERSQVRISPEGGATDTGYEASEPYRETGFFASLKNLFVPEEDRYAFAEGLRRGRFLVSAQLDEAKLSRATDVLEQAGALDIDAEETSWRQSGWKGYDVAAHGAARSTTGMTQAGTARAGTMTGGAGAGTTAATGGGVAGTAGSGTGMAGGMTGSGMSDRAMTGTGLGAGRAGVPGSTDRRAAMASEAGREEVIPLAEEQLVIGKRVVERGQVRVRTYVVERPAEAQVTLRDETVEVERRAVDRPLTDEAGAFSERVVEVTETDEEPVVSKEARIVEEVAVHKRAAERTETVRDTVRRTEVDIENGAGRMPAGAMPPGAGVGHGAQASMGGARSDNPDGTPGNPPGTMLSRGADQALGTNMSGAHPENERRGSMTSDNPDGTPGNPPGTMLSRGADQVLGTNMSGAHPENERRDSSAGHHTGSTSATGMRDDPGGMTPEGTRGDAPGNPVTRAADRAMNTNLSGAHPEHEAPDGTGGNPPGTMASRAVDKTLGTNVSGAKPGSRKK